jgi:hypothetical protein
MEWGRGNKLENPQVVSVLSMVYFIFLSINNISFIGLNNFQNFSAIITRLAQVFDMEECKISRVTGVSQKDVSV